MSASEHQLTISELAHRAGVAPSALRYYEEIGLLPAPSRVSGQRRYPETAIEQVGAILLLSDAGYTLAEQKDLMAAWEVGTQAWHPLAQRKLAALDEQLVRLQAAREAIAHSLHCPHENTRTCPSFRRLVAARLAGQHLHELHEE